MSSNANANNASGAEGEGRDSRMTYKGTEKHGTRNDFRRHEINEMQLRARTELGAQGLTELYSSTRDQNRKEYE